MVLTAFRGDANDAGPVLSATTFRATGASAMNRALARRIGLRQAENHTASRQSERLEKVWQR